MHFQRSLDQELRAAARTRPSLILTGARQVGKTTLLRHAFPTAEYVTFDNMLLAASAKESPNTFLDRFDGPVILDEIQYVPELFPALKERIDADRDVNGRWLLTGSQRFSLMRNLGESLAGRIAIFELLPLSAEELGSELIDYSSECIRLPYRGGYPELWTNREIDSKAWFEDYIRTYLERDLRELVQVKNLLDFRRFLGMAAARSGELINYSDLARGIGVSLNTIKTWISALEASGIVYILPPFHRNFEKRLIKTPKLYFTDTGLLCALLNIGSEEEAAKTPFAGFIWETFVFSELIKTMDARPGRDLFFYRDAAGAEIDFIIDRADRPLLIEAKNSQRIRSDRLAFGTIDELFPSAESRRLVAAPSGERRPLRMNGYTVYDPRLSGPDEA